MTGDIRNRNAAQCRRRGRGEGGFTLLEVVMAVAILTLVFLATLLELFAVVRQNRLTAMEITATNVMRRQLEEAVAAAGDNQKAAKGAAKGVVRYLMAIRDRLDTRAAGAYPVVVATDRAAGTITYEFVVPAPGSASRDLTSAAADEQNAYDRARGRMIVYLRENAVPTDFSVWNNMKAGTTGPTPARLAGFDMNGDGKLDGDFLALTENAMGGVDRYAETSMFSLPVRFQVDFYPSVAAKNADRPFYTSTRNRIINDDAIVSSVK